MSEKKKNGSMFVYNDKLIKIKIRVQYVFDEDGEQTGVKILRGNEPIEDEDVRDLECYAAVPNWGEFSRLTEMANVINSKTGLPMLRIPILYFMIILTFFKKWNLVDDRNPDKEVPIASETIQMLHYVIVRALARTWLKTTIGLLNKK